jgi:hypothetical protein
MANNGKRTGDNRNGNNGHSSSSGNAVKPPHFASRLISTIPHGRKGKHNQIVSMILDDLEKLDLEKAVLVPIDSLEGEKMENVRSALNRATRQRKMFVATATDDKYFYVWRTEPKKAQAITPPGRLASQNSAQR